MKIGTSVAMFVIITLILLLVGASTLYGQTDQGGAYVAWNPIYPTPAYDTYDWTITILQLPNVQSSYYWALQNGFVGSSAAAFYMGLQPYGSCGITNNGLCENALFSFFGNGASSASSSCAPGADNGPGEQCRIPYNWVIGRPYTLRAALTANNGTVETWTGTVTDSVTGIQTTIGSWSIPSSDGLIGSQGISFTEYYTAYVGGCSAEPYAAVVWNFPIGYSNGQAYPNEVRQAFPTAACSSNVSFTIGSGSVTVQTGGNVVSSLPDVGGFAQVVSGSGWETSIRLTNNSGATVTSLINFYANDGSPLTLPLTFPNSSLADASSSSVSLTFAPKQQLIIQTGPTSGPLSVGWADVHASGPLKGYEIFSLSPLTGLASEATITLDARESSAMELPYDNTNGSQTGIALANQSSSPASLTAVLLDQNGTQIASSQLSLSAFGHTSFFLTDQFSQAANRVGVINFQNPSGNVTGVGLLFSSGGRFTNLPIIQ